METTFFPEEDIEALSRLPVEQLEAQRGRFEAAAEDLAAGGAATLVELKEFIATVGADLSQDFCLRCFEIFDRNASGKVDWRCFLLGIATISSLQKDWTSQRTRLVFEIFARQDKSAMQYSEFLAIICMTQGTRQELTRSGSLPESEPGFEPSEICKWLLRGGGHKAEEGASVTFEEFSAITREFWHLGNLSGLLGERTGAHPLSTNLAVSARGRVRLHCAL